MFRLTGGLYRGKKLLLPPQDITRPTSSRAKEALFNCLFSLGFNMSGATIIDGFAGSGAIGLECLSRGAHFCTFIESNPDIQAILNENIKILKMAHSSEIASSFDMYQKSATKKAADFVFLDPPYFSHEKGLLLYNYALATLKGSMAPSAIIVIETDAKEILIHNEPPLNAFSFLFEKMYGAAKLSFYKNST